VNKNATCRIKPAGRFLETSVQTRKNNTLFSEQELFGKELLL